MDEQIITQDITPLVLKNLFVSPDTFLIENEPLVVTGSDSSVMIKILVRGEILPLPSSLGTSPPVLMVNVFRDLRAFPLASFLIHDDGTGRDSIAGDLKYKGELNYRTSKSSSGRLFLVALAEIRKGWNSNSIVIPLTLIGKADAPIIRSVHMPDTVFLGTTNKLITLAVEVIDPNGLDDISRVYFNSFLPNGNPSSGNPFLLNDQGAGAYSLTIMLPPTASVGSYRFDFQAVDKSGLSSQIQSRNLVVLP